MSAGRSRPAVDRRAAMRAGVVQIFPLMLTAFPFGLIYGATAADSGLDPAVAIAASWIVLAGAAQLALVDLIEDAAPWTIAVGTALVINLRFALYSASLAPAFRAFPWPWRLGLPYALTDQAAVTAIFEFERSADPVWRRWFFLGAAFSFICVWWVGTVIGVELGAEIPDWVQLPFAVPLTFLALLVPALRDRPAVLAALAGGATCVATAALPNSLNLVVGAVVGVIVGVVAAEHAPTKVVRP